MYLQAYRFHNHLKTIASNHFETQKPWSQMILNWSTNSVCRLKSMCSNIAFTMVWSPCCQLHFEARNLEDKETIIYLPTNNAYLSLHTNLSGAVKYHSHCDMKTIASSDFETQVRSVLWLANAPHSWAPLFWRHQSLHLLPCDWLRLPSIRTLSHINLNCANSTRKKRWPDFVFVWVSANRIQDDCVVLNGERDTAAGW